MVSNSSLSLDEQVALIEKAERAYEASDRWKTLTGRYGEYAVLHHPYTDLASMAGEVLHTAQIEPSSTDNQVISENRKKLVPMIRGEGGILAFDNEFEIGHLNPIASYLPQSDLSKISRAVWEQRVIGYVKGIFPTLKEAASLEDTPENEERTGYICEDLLNRFAFTQTYLTAKKQGLTAVKQ